MFDKNTDYACVNVTSRRVRVTIVAVGKTVVMTYSECMSVALVIQHAKHMRNIILPYVACTALPGFATFSFKRHDCRKKVIEQKYVYIFS
jgi:hypothetical protein